MEKKTPIFFLPLLRFLFLRRIEGEERRRAGFFFDAEDVTFFPQTSVFSQSSGCSCKKEGRREYQRSPQILSLPFFSPVSFVKRSFLKNPPPTASPSSFFLKIVVEHLSSSSPPLGRNRLATREGMWWCNLSSFLFPIPPPSLTTLGAPFRLFFPPPLAPRRALHRPGQSKRFPSFLFPSPLSFQIHRCLSFSSSQLRKSRRGRLWRPFPTSHPLPFPFFPLPFLSSDPLGFFFFLFSPQGATMKLKGMSNASLFSPFNLVTDLLSPLFFFFLPKRMTEGRR